MRPDIYGSDDNKAVMIDGVRYDLPPGNADWIDIVQNIQGQFRLVDQDPSNQNVIDTIRVDNVAGYPRELRNFNTAAVLTKNYTGNIQTPASYAGLQTTPVEIDFAGWIPLRAKGVHIFFESVISTPLTGEVIVCLSPDDTHFVERHSITKEGVANLRVWFKADVFFRRQRGQKVMYCNVNSGGGQLAQCMTAPKIRIHGWWM